METKLFQLCFWTVLYWGSCKARSAGREFATAFMQNYLAVHEQPLFQLYISSLHSSCWVKINVPGLRFTHESQLAAGQGINVTLPNEIELYGSKKSRNTALIQATDDVTVTSLNSKLYTADTSLLYPMSEWGTEYFIFTPSNSPPSMLKEFVLVNGKEQNIVEVFLRAAVRFEGRLYGVGSKLVVLMEPYENAQIQSQGDLTGTRVSSQTPVAVYSGHMCTWRFSKCNHVFEQLLPVQSWGTQFLVAPLNVQSQFDTVYIQASQSTNITLQSGHFTSTDILQRGLILEYKVEFPEGLHIIADKGIQVLFLFNGVRTSRGQMYDPFLINLLPNNHFCSSYALKGLAGFENRAILIVSTNERAGINFDSLNLPRNIQWRVFKGSEYSWTELVYQSGAGRHIVTHPSASFGLYSVGIEQVNGYGSAAPCIDTEVLPAPRSCSGLTCSLDEECQMQGSYPICVKKPVATCWAMGDPHYYTFDGRYFDFMGTCTYVLAKNCEANDNLPAFEVLAKNENRGSTKVSYVARVTVNIGGITISAMSSEPGKVMVDQIMWSLPVFLDDVGVSVFQSGQFITILLSPGLSVQYDWNHYLVITLPSTFMNKVRGLCGNFNGDPNDDFAMPSSIQAHNVTELGRSWKVPNLALDEGCTDDCGGHCYGCDAQELRQWQKKEFCGLLIVEPFIQCHSIIDPSVYIQNCLYDVCMTDGHRYYLCKALEVYADACQRVGIKLTNWREAANCPYRCPENSHYELCGSPCPLTCFGLGSTANCTLPCVETCICDPGFVLSGTKCVPSTHCGCSYNGHYISAGETFWVDDACQRLCRCSEGGNLECEEVGCRAGQHCQVVNGIRDCYAISESTCIAMGDPHYYTFDRRSYDFQGNCVYQLVGLCATDPGLVPFDILVQNDFRGSTVVSFTKLLEIKVYNISIVIDKDYYGYVTVNGELLNLPLHLIEGQVSVFKSGWSAVIQTSFGLKVTFDWNSIATVTLPSTYRGAVCGLCGNYNGNPEDDLTLKETTLPASGPEEFGASWHVPEIPGCVHGCTGICPDCDPTTKRLYETSEFCGLLHDQWGPFKNCHATLDPTMYFENCVNDVCLYNGRRDVLCQAITAYVSACQALGIFIGPWRTSQFCGVQCPIHSHYELCGSACEVTCLNLAPPTGCHSFCKEGCMCDEGYILSGHRCVPLSQCGCLYLNRYYSFGQVFYPGTGCQRECKCMQYGQVVCNELSCGPSEKCELVNGVRKCQPIGQALCLASGDPHYMTYDRLYYDFQGACTYVLSQACGLESTNLSPFSIHVENERWPYTYSKLSVTKQVSMIIYGNTIILKKQMPQILVNGVLTNLPYSSNSLNGTLVKVYKDGVNHVIKTDFGLQVTYDLYYYVTVTIPGNYRGKTCGLCGNFDGIPSNDFRLPGGRFTHDVKEFGSAWKVDILGELCEDGCEENKCLVCDSKLKAIFEQRPYCGVLVDPNGPFARCHPVINSLAYLNNCVFDTCASDGSREVVCESVASYAQSCLTAGVDIDRWRTDSFCPMSCPANSHYELCANTCAAACPGLTSIVQCPKTCTEGCTCELGYLFNGQQCVQHQQCGCYMDGHTYEAGEVVYLHQCQKRCTCDPGQGLTCESHTCASGTQCLLRDGVMACYHQDPCEDILCREKETCRIEQDKAVCVPLYNATCWAWGDPHYHSFDGYDYDFQGTCNYILSQTCGNISGLVPFSITQRNEYRGSLTVSYVREVEVFIYGRTFTMVRHQTAQIMVDGLLSYLPLDLHGGRLAVRHSGTTVVLVTDFGLRVHYDWDSEVYLQLPSSYYGGVCGLCGNFNGNSSDELSDPAGSPMPSVSQWAKSWRAEDSGLMSDCHDGCETDCPVCPSDQQALYETQALCGALTTAQSVFVACHTKVNPQVFQHGCVYDLCLNHGDRELLCQALESYINQCRLEGVIITDWREEFNCSMNCQPNSHYEACASPCPVTCPHKSQQPVCSDSCVEACVCNSGFILSAGTCVPADQCGCIFEGTYYQPGQSFWLDEGCHQLCECDRSLGVVVCRDSSCGPTEICSVVDGRRSCQPASTALCFATGDPHYRTFDGHHFNFQGTCVYQLAALCEDKEGLVPFNVTVQNEHRGNTAVSFPKTVNVFVNGFTVTMTREHPYQILFDGQLAQLPLSIPNEFMVYRMGGTAVLNTDFGLKVTFDWGRRASITIPFAYRGTMCGLCGNFNGVVEDDLTMCNGMMAPNVSSLGQSWQVAATPDCSSAGCHGDECPTCTSPQRQVALDHCDIITNHTGPFRECHSRIDPSSYLEDCIFDYCSFQGHQSVICDAVAAYASACQGEGLTVYPWRNATFCPMFCPTNSHYNPCAPSCTETCVNLFTDRSCDSPCTEACQCDHGYVLSAQSCVPPSECGCFYKGRYYEKHQKFYINEQCSELCICAENGTVECQASVCGTGETCGVVGGVLGCHPIDYRSCVVTGDPHYMSFDGRWFDFQGTCVYTLAKVCDQTGGRLVYFSVDTQNEGIGNWGVSVLMNLTVTVYNWTVGIRRGENWRVLVNNEYVNLPVSLDNRVMINQVGFSVMLQTDFGLKVLYDTSYHAEVHVPSSYQGSMCGLCGNYNSNPADDFLFPNGTQSASIDAFGQAWAAALSGDKCGGCEGHCQQCDQLKAHAYQGNDACGLMATDAGPFSACHDRVNPQPYVNNCAFDMCAVDGDRDILCQNLQAYATVCQQAGVKIMPWRNESFCSPECPANSHYAQCTNNCANTCASLTSTGSCTDICMEGCECDEGFVSDGDQCVSLGDCGCIHNGKYLRAGEVVYLHQCQKRCTCDPGQGLTCESHTCASGTQCLLRDGVMACYHQDPCEDILCREKEICRIEQGKAVCVPLDNATCWAWGDPHYHSFDGYDYDFQGTCNYILSQTCGNISGLVPFSITQRNEYRGSLTVSYVREVEVFIYGRTFTMVRHQTAQIMVDGLLSYLPLDLHGGRLAVRHSGTTVVLVTDFGLRVHYDWDSEVYLQLPSSYYGVVCGLCGNFNGNSSDELSDPAGNPMPSVSQWAKSWRAEDSGLMSDCHDGCETDCPVCPSDQQALYETQALCGALTTAQSVFVACHTKVNPQVFQHGCVYDLCLNHGDRELLCQALESYINQCRLEGVIITDWREEFNCSMNCQPNSHYEACASPCPVTCPHKSQQPVCSDSCVEACVCNSGFILSAGTCVPADQCGCIFEGTYYQPGQSFWLDEGCHQLCECDRSLGVVVCRDSSCGPTEICSVVDGRRSCQPASTALCFATGDPHYRTFDGHHFNFQGTCVYQLAALCEDKEGLVPFNVTVQNEHRGNTAVSFPKTVNVFVNGFTVTMTREHPYQILFDGQLAQLPLSIPNEFMVYRMGGTAVLNTDFGLKVTFDWGRRASITIPFAYRGTMCGLCGNFNGVVEDDLTMCNGMMAPNVSSLGQSWQVAATPDCSSAGCHGDECPTCTSPQRQVALDHCDIITNHTGPFRECHSRIDPSSYLEDCIFDYCSFQGHQSVICDAVAAYASACQGEGLTVYPWRNATFCPMFCPTNSHYNPCAPSCTETCVNLFTDRSCDSPCTEACQCDHGYVLSAQNCVPPSECGCFYKGRYYEKHQKFYINEQCSELCICAENGTVECQASVCGTGETCGVVGGVLGCHPIDYRSCVVTGDPHYMSFDGRWFDFQGTCVYTLAKVCDQTGGRLVYFSVDTQNEGIGNWGVSVLMNLTVTVYNWTVGIRRGENWRVLVNNEYVNLPVSLDNRVMINQVGFSVMLQTDFGLKVLYDTSYHAEVHVPSSYQGSMCGLCGNYNSNPADDFLFPNGTQSASIDAFGQAWAAALSGDKCGGCEGHCQQCDQLKAHAYQGNDACGLMATDAGPFSACHDRVNPQPYVNNCAFDMCAVDGDRDILCQNLQAYATVCQQAGVKIMPWRNESFCLPECPANSHYAQCTNNCANTCASLTSTGSCTDICMEGCECDEGFVSDGDQCVSLGDCGCIHNGKYLRVGEVSVTDTCNTRCVCHTGGVLECVHQACSTGEICDVQNGTRGCYPESAHCVFDTGDRLQRFDGVVGLVMSPGAFQMAFLCDEESPDWFRVVIDVRGCATSEPVDVTSVHVFIQGMIITVNSHLHSWVNGKRVSYPIMPQEGLSICYRNEAVVIESSDVKVTYSLADGVGITVSRELMGRVCGACGNLNGDALDDMTTSDGSSSSMMSEDVSSWHAEDFFTCDA